MKKFISSFEDLKVYQEARKLRNKVYELTKKLPEHERYNLISQIKRAALSLTNNIAEGFGRFHYQENIQFCRQARGSLCELIDQIMAISDFKYVDREVVEGLLAEAKVVYRLLNAYIKATEKRKKEMKIRNQ